MAWRAWRGGGMWGGSPLPQTVRDAGGGGRTARAQSRAARRRRRWRVWQARGAPHAVRGERSTAISVRAFFLGAGDRLRVNR